VKFAETPGENVLVGLVLVSCAVALWSELQMPTAIPITVPFITTFWMMCGGVGIIFLLMGAVRMIAASRQAARGTPPPPPPARMNKGPGHMIQKPTSVPVPEELGAVGAGLQPAQIGYQGVIRQQE
jgi:hypothetical protein